MESEAEYMAKSILNSAKVQSEVYFSLQEQLINKTAIIYKDLMLKRPVSEGESD